MFVLETACHVLSFILKLIMKNLERTARANCMLYVTVDNRRRHCRNTKNAQCIFKYMTRGYETQMQWSLARHPICKIIPRLLHSIKYVPKLSAGSTSVYH